MNILLVLIPVTMLVIGIAVALFFWAVNHQQFDDLDSPGVLPLMDAADDQSLAGVASTTDQSGSGDATSEAVDQASSPQAACAAAPLAAADAGHDQPS